MIMNYRQKLNFSLIHHYYEKVVTDNLQLKLG